MSPPPVGFSLSLLTGVGGSSCAMCVFIHLCETHTEKQFSTNTGRPRGWRPSVSRTVTGEALLHGPGRGGCAGGVRYCLKPPFQHLHVFHLNVTSCFGVRALFYQLKRARQEERPPVFVDAPRPVWAGNPRVAPPPPLEVDRRHSRREDNLLEGLLSGGSDLILDLQTCRLASALVPSPLWNLRTPSLGSTCKSITNIH